MFRTRLEFDPFKFGQVSRSRTATRSRSPGARLELESFEFGRHATLLVGAPAPLSKLPAPRRCPLLERLDVSFCEQLGCASALLQKEDGLPLIQ